MLPAFVYKAGRKVSFCPAGILNHLIGIVGTTEQVPGTRVLES